MFDGFLFIDKPTGPTSHDVVDRVRQLIREDCKLKAESCKLPKVGHAGTLDPFATGLLIIGIGKATKELGKLAGLDKEYEATMRLGAISDTYDRTGKITRTADRLPPTATIEAAIEKFVGTIEQIPPMYSAKKVHGKKLYELARAGIEIKRKPIKVTIYSIDVADLNATRWTLNARIKCSSGTYIRSLAHDIGQALGCGAYLDELRRTSIGPWSVKKAEPLAALTVENFPMHLKSTKEVLEQVRIV
ncbi:tRNA pseudouridine(55) synthase TruB [Candidatus Uhrbacteria bacterium]|nr:tRNA pseudouridine(55) synthase TruB [Candidatus Uhrbacteria bacterium]